MKRIVTTIITRHTLIGGDDNPNCFSLAFPGSPLSVAIVNMRMGPFERVSREFLVDGRVEVEMLDERCGIVTDARVPKHELEERWCRVCCPFPLLPDVEQRAMLRYTAPEIRDGKLLAWTSRIGQEHTPEQVEEFLRALREIGEA